MKRVIVALGLIVSLVFSSMGAMAQQTPTPMPAGTPELAAIGETGPGGTMAGQDMPMDELVRLAVQDTTVMWAEFFAAGDLAFVPPTVVLVGDGMYARSGCGINSGDPDDRPTMNPAFYCIYGGETGLQVVESSVIYPTQYIYSPVIYFSLSWLDRHFSTTVLNVDVAVAYMVSHVYAHHVQYLLGYMDFTGGGCCDYTDVELELAADCFAGVWAYSAYDRGQLDASDIRAAQAASWGPGSDRSDEFGREGEHGSPDEQLRAFMLGYEGGHASQCFDS